MTSAPGGPVAPSETRPAYYRDEWLTIREGDCRAVLAEMESESVHCVVTSPPYWGLRDYGTATWEGGDPACDHRLTDEEFERGYRTFTVGVGAGGVRAAANARWTRNGCPRCGATRIDSQLGLEPTPEEYVAALVDVFRAVRRVLRSDGTVWLNLGDSYANANPTGRRDADRRGEAGVFTGGEWRNRQASGGGAFVKPLPFGLKPKDLVGIPWRVAFALQADGWYLRSDIIWSKPNPMPESVTDRPTKSHEYVFLLSKSARYFFDAEAVKETPHSGPSDLRKMAEQLPRIGGKTLTATDPLYMANQTTNIGKKRGVGDPSGRNIRSVWTIATAPYPGAHFATFPPKLVEPCIKAGTSERGVCPECGAPWERVVEKGELRPVRGEYLGPIEEGAKLDGRAGFHGAGKGGMVRTTEGWSFLKRDSITTGWAPTCGCYVGWKEGCCPDALEEEAPECGCKCHGPETVPAVVMDPFAGTGTVGLVAQRLSRRAVLIDLNAEYLRQCLVRNAQTPLGLEVPA